LLKVFGRFVVVTAVLAAAGGGAWWYWGARADTRPPPRTQAVAMGTVEDTVSAVGTLQPLNYVDVGVQVSGQLRRIFVTYGEKVSQGQLLAEIDPTVFEARVGADQAQLLNLRAQVSERMAQRGLAEKQAERQRRLMAERATSQDALDVAEAQVKANAAQIEALQAQIKQTENNLRSNQASLSYTKIYAPMNGTVVDVIARQGQTLNANQQAPLVLRIADLDTMTVWTQVSEADVPKLRTGMDAWFVTLGQPDRRRQGKLRQVLPTPQVVNNVVLYNALFDVGNPEHDLLPQMSAQVFFVVAHAENVPIVPMSALRPAVKRGKRYAAMVMENGVPTERIIEIGATNRVMAEVKSGLKPGEEVVLDAGRERPPQPGGPASARTPRL
jgi:macrolide-specific efflux system membrane fusion protein